MVGKTEKESKEIAKSKETAAQKAKKAKGNELEKMILDECVALTNGSKGHLQDLMAMTKIYMEKNKK